MYMHAKLLQPCLTLCDPTYCSPPDSSVHGILQATMLEWVAMPSSRESSQPRDQSYISYISYIGRRVLYHQRHQDVQCVHDITFIPTTQGGPLYQPLEFSSTSEEQGVCPRVTQRGRTQATVFTAEPTPFLPCPQSK